MSNSQVGPTAINTAAGVTVDNAESKIKQYLSQHFLVNFGSEAQDDTDLFERGFIDSFGYVELIGYLEKEFKIRFSDEELISRGLNSLRSMTSMVTSKLNAN